MSGNLVFKQELTDMVLFDSPSIQNTSKKRKLNIKEENEEPAKKRMFRMKWLELPEFENWLSEGLLPHHGFCSVCQATVAATKSELLAHSKTKKHIRNLITQKQCMYNLETDMSVTDDSGDADNLRIIDLRCDSLSVPSKEMIYAMLDARTGDSSFDTDESLKEVEESLAQMLNKESGLFFPTHTMANLVAVLTHCQARGSTVIAGEDSDINCSNKEALVKFGGLHFCPLNELEDGTFRLEDLDRLLKTLDHPFPLSCLVCFECPHTRKGGKVLPFEWINQLELLCSSEELLLHCDGTRLINASLSLNVSPSRFVSHCDSVTFAFDKGLGAPIGAVLVGKEVFIKRATFIRNFIGGNIHQAGTFAAAGTFGLNHTLANVDCDHDRATAIAIAVARVKSSHVSVKVNSVHTNIVHLHCTSSFNAKHLRERLTSVSEDEITHFKDEIIVVLGEDINKQTLALMVHNNLSDNDIRVTIKKLLFVMEELELNPVKSLIPRMK